MNLTTGLIPNITTSALKLPTQTLKPELREVSNEDFQNFTYTGLKVVIPTPFFKYTSDALFAINIDGFIPPFNFMSIDRFFKNLFPLQATAASHDLPGFEVLYEVAQLPALFNYLSFRYISGQVKIGMRITSNTQQSGNFLITQLSGGLRYFYLPTENYTGLRFINTSVAGIDYAPNGFALLDLSLNRSCSITPARRDNTLITDFHKKLSFILDFDTRFNDADLIYENQFLEDWLLFTPQGDFPHDVTSTVNIAFYYDWSEVKFSVPSVPFIPRIIFGSDAPDYQILKYSSTFNNSAPDTDPKQWIWYPKSHNALKNAKHKKAHKHHTTIPSITEILNHE